MFSGAHVCHNLNSKYVYQCVCVYLNLKSLPDFMLILVSLVVLLVFETLF